MGFTASSVRRRQDARPALNDLIAHSFISVGIPVTKEPSGISRTNGKHPDGMTLVPWSSGKPLTWDVTVACSLAMFYLDAAANNPGSAVDTAAERKTAKYAHLGYLGTQFLFQPIAVESLGVGATVLVDLGRKIAARSGDDREGSFLFQRISVLLHRFNSVLLHNSFVLFTAGSECHFISISYPISYTPLVDTKGKKK